MPKVVEAFNLKSVDVDVGVEIELEGHNFHPYPPANWRKERDPSLRGEESAEYVLRKPVNINDLKLVLKQLQDHFDKTGAVLDPSYRAGVHVHVNVQDLTITQLFNFIVLFLIMEEVFIDFCDKSRKGNHFCLRATDAEYLVYTLRNCCRNGALHLLDTEDIRYSAMNVTSLFKYGSVEFRSLESTKDFDKINTWANMLCQLRKVALTFKTPIQIMESISGNGFENFAAHIMGEWFPIISGQKDVQKKIRRGVLNAQDLAYSRKWGLVNLNIFKKGGQFE
jgi:hypothetical protein